ncbi:Arrestin domain-containing protein 3 [Nibea albiflora]|uniref:Arrestin domain-containing protein 3 n=1 Tax=Nibea albiflora TaxID=240163 RepID=A0ACB7FCV3_NIBAL|nr:Arrestin domain-containing protein 3 [Nibea albiflora]
MSPIKDFKLTYEVLNEEDTFSEGDTVAGTVTFTLTKGIKVKKIFVKLTGDARVHWTEGSGDDETSYSASKRYFKAKEYLVEESYTGTVLPTGINQFKFSLRIPQDDMPSSFKGPYGNITYTVTARLSRSWHMDTKVQKELKFLSKSSSMGYGQIKCPHSGTVDKEVGVFSKGQVQMSATVDRKVCSPGDTLSVVAKICNSSSKKMTPKFCVEQRAVYMAGSNSTVSHQRLCKVVGDPLQRNEETVSCQLTIPADAVYTISNCEILSVEYCLKVYLDISFAIDPEVVLPLMIVRSAFTTLHPGEAMGPYPAGPPGAPSYSDFPPPAFPAGPCPVPTGPPYLAPVGPDANGYPAPYPAQQATSGFNNQWPQQVAPYGFPTAAFPPSSEQHQAPTAPPVFQPKEEPPNYMSLFPSSH